MKFISILYIKMFVRKMINGSHSGKINMFFSDANKFVILMPNVSAEFAEAVSVIRYLKKAGKFITVILHTDLQQSMNSAEFDNLISYGTNDQNRYGFPVATLKETLSAVSCDVVIDTNLHEDYFSYLIVKEINSRFKVGFIKTLSDKFYNIQIAVNSASPEVCYKNFLNCLEMF